MKVRASDCLYILRKFSIATTEHLPRDVSRLTVTNPRAVNTMAAFRFLSDQYAILFDDTAEDDEVYILAQVATVLPGRNVSLLENPQSSVSTYALPYEGKAVYLLKVDADKQRLDNLLAATRPELSRSSWQKHIRAGRISVDGAIQTLPKYAVDSSSEIVVNLPAAPTHAHRELPIVYLDDDVIVIDKPAGVLTHSKNQLDDEFTVADFFRRYTTHELEGGRPGVVHRLDRDTSGLVIGARHQRAYDHLKTQFANRDVDKTYVAVVDGAPEHEMMHIDLPIVRNPSRPGSFMVRSDGKSAQTDLKVVRRGGGKSLVELKPRTGRTHQLRVHLANLKLPIVGDRLYGTPADRLYLHATGLGLTLPNGEPGRFESVVPDEFGDALNEVQ